MQNIQIFDTTLRDGMQGIEVNFTLDDKIQIARKLDELKIDYIEGGFPLSNKKEMRFFELMRKETLSHAKLVAFGSTRRPGGKAAEDKNIQALVAVETPAAIVVGKSWLAHVKQVLGTDPEENLAMIHDSIEYLKSEGREALFDLEHFFDGYNDNPEYAIRVLKTATEAGADMLVLCDTNGGMLPSDVRRVLDGLPRNELAPLGVHFHNDTGCAVANSLSGLECGAVHVQGTINGWGERCGNANLCTIIPNICLKTPMHCNAESKLADLTMLSRFVAEKSNILPDKRMPYVGEAAFSHKAGQHADVIKKASVLMEHIDGAEVGNERHILLSELAGKSTIIDKLSPYGDFRKDSPEVNDLIQVLKTQERNGYQYEAAEASFDLLMKRTLGLYRPIMELGNYHLESFKTGRHPSKTIGRIFLTVDGRQIMGAGVGVGPVETLDAALRDALMPFFPFLANIRLVDYKVRILNPESSTAAKTRVFITSADKAEHSWDTVGVSGNIVEASWEAIVDSLEYYYNNLDEGKA